MQYISKQPPQGCLIRECANGNEEAYKVAATLYVYIDWLDNVVDGDIPTNLKESSKVSMNLMMMMAFNPFFLEHKDRLVPVLLAAYNAWQSSDLCKDHSDYRVRIAADVLKGYFLQVFYVIAFITGGADYANALSEKWCGFDFDALPDQAAPAESTKVAPGRPMSFPNDHRSHPEYPVEWWYAAGSVCDGQSEVGCHVVQFCVHGTYHYHVGIISPTTGKFTHFHDTGTESKLNFQHPNRFVFDHKFPGAGVSLEFKQSSEVVLQGGDGYSKKSDRPNHASYYYSIPEMRVTGCILTDTGVIPVDGTMWFDHEFGSSMKPDNFKWAFFFAKMAGRWVNGYLMIEDGVVNLEYSKCAYVQRDGTRVDLPVVHVTGVPTVDTPEFIVHTPDGDFMVSLLGEGPPRLFQSALGTYLEQPCQVVHPKSGVSGAGYLEITS